MIKARIPTLPPLPPPDKRHKLDWAAKIRADGRLGTGEADEPSRPPMRTKRAPDNRADFVAGADNEPGGGAEASSAEMMAGRPAGETDKFSRFPPAACHTTAEYVSIFRMCHARPRASPKWTGAGRGVATRLALRHAHA